MPPFTHHQRQFPPTFRSCPKAKVHAARRRRRRTGRHRGPQARWAVPAGVRFRRHRRRWHTHHRPGGIGGGDRFTALRCRRGGLPAHPGDVLRDRQAAGFASSAPHNRCLTTLAHRPATTVRRCELVGKRPISHQTGTFGPRWAADALAAPRRCRATRARSGAAPSCAPPAHLPHILSTAWAPARRNASHKR